LSGQKLWKSDVQESNSNAIFISLYKNFLFYISKKKLIKRWCKCTKYFAMKNEQRVIKIFNTFADIFKQ